jgi:hypothetical protein
MGPLRQTCAWLVQAALSFGVLAFLFLSPGVAAIAASTACAIEATCEAESAALGGGVVVRASYAGYSGAGFADYGGSGAGYVEWTVHVPAAGTYWLNFRYANGGTTDRPMSIRVNGTIVNGALSFPRTGWKNWTVRTQSVNVPAGVITIRATEIASGPKVDNLTVTSGAAPTIVPTPRPKPTSTSPPAGCDVGAVCEAETALLGGGVTSSARHAGYSGRGFADYGGNSTGFVEWTVIVPTAGTYSLSIRYANGGRGDRPMSISVNGTVVNDRVSFPVTGWTTWTLTTQSVSLPAGPVRIRATETPNGPNLDNLTVSVGTPSPPTPAVRGLPAWAPNVAYEVGTRATYGTATYRCIKAHRSQIGWEPPNVASLWALQDDGPHNTTR